MKRGKRAISCVLVLLMMATMCFSSISYAATVDDTFEFKIQGSDDGVKYGTRDTMKIEFQAITKSNGWLTTIQQVNIAYDNELFELVTADGTKSIDELAAYSQSQAPANRFDSAVPGEKTYKYVPTALTPNIYALPSANFTDSSCSNGYVITADEKTGFLQLQANGKGAQSIGSYTTMSYARLALREGKTWEDINNKSIRFLQRSELDLVTQAYVTQATDGDKITIEWGRRDGQDTMKEPTIDYPGINNAPPAEQKPGAPTNVTARATGKTTAEVTWTAPILATGVPAVTQYAITADGFAGMTVDGTLEKAEITGLTEGASYTFQVAAGNKNGMGEKAAAAAVTTWTKAGAPTGLSVKVSGSEKLTYQWSKPEQDGGSAVKSYKLYVYTGSLDGTPIAGSPFTINAADGLKKELTNTDGIASGTEYFAKITAINETNEEGSAASFDAITAKNQISADTPSFNPDLSAAPIAKFYGDSLELTVQATANAANPDSAIAPVISYQWYKAEATAAGEAAAEGTAIAGATAATYKVDKLTEVGTAEYYCVATNLDKGVDQLDEAIRGSNTTTASSVRATVTVAAKEPEIRELTLSAGNKKIDAKWDVEANGAEATYEIELSHKTTTQSAVVTVYEYLDGSGAAQTVRVTAGAVDPTFTSGAGLRWITDGAVAYPVATTSAITAEITPAGIEVDYTGTSTASSMSFTELTNNTLYTVKLIAKNSVGSSEPMIKTATPKASSGGGGGGGGGSSSGTTTTGTDIKKEIPSSGSVSISTSELKDGKSIEAKNTQITVTLNQQAINALDKTTGLIIKTEKKSGVTMNDAANGFVGGRPVFDVTATQNGKAVTNFGSGKITISIAYTPASGENTGKLFLYTINDKGEAERVSGSKYDATLKAVTGQTNHLSLYAVGYDEKAADTTKPVTTFQDVSSSDWFYTAVMELAGKEILSGFPVEDAKGKLTGAYQFKPQNNVTRAEFAMILAKAAGADLSKYSAKVFNDVSTDAWYAGAVNWANSVGVASGTGEGNFSPRANITRQDMAVMVSKYIANVAKTTLTAKNEKITFTDAAQIADYAKTAVEGMQTAGVISGVPNEQTKDNPIETYQFKPSANATRAEAAAMVSGLLKAL